MHRYKTAENVAMVSPSDLVGVPFHEHEPFRAACGTKG